MAAFDAWTERDWILHYAGPRFDARAPKPGIWDAQGRLLPGDPAAHPAVRARAGQGVQAGHASGAIMYRQDDVRNEKIRVDAKYRSVMEDVSACALLTNADRVGFSQQLDAWQRFYCGDEPQCAQPAAGVWNTVEQMQQIRDFETTLYEWQQKVSKKGCALSAPIEQPKAPGEDPGGSTLKSIETIAIAAAVVVGVFALAPLLKGAGEAMSGAGSAARGIGSMALSRARGA